LLAQYHFGRSEFGWGVVYTGFAALDLFLVKAAVQAALGGVCRIIGYRSGSLAARGGFGAKGLYTPPTGMADDAVKAAYLAEANSHSFRIKLGIHNALTPFHSRTSVAAVREAVENGAFGRGSFTVKMLADGRMLFGGSGTRTSLNRQLFHHELIHVSQLVKNPNLWSEFPLRMLHEPVQLLTAHGAIGWPTLGVGVWYAVNWWNE